MNWIDWLWIGIYVLGALGLTWLARVRSRQDLNDFFGGNGRMGWGLVGLSMVATTFSADTPLAVTGIIRSNGISGNWLWWNMVLGGTLTTFFFARLWRRASVLTDLELVEIRYSDRWAKPLRRIKAVWYGLVINSLILAWVNVAMLTVLEVYLGLDRYPAMLILAILICLTIVSVGAGGLRGVIYVDAFQFGLAIIGAIVLAIWAIQEDAIGGLSGLRKQLKVAGTLEFFPSIGGNKEAGQLVISWGHVIAFLGLQWWASWYPGAEPGGGGYIAQRMLSSSHEGGALKSVLLFQFLHYAVRPWPWILVGLSCLILYPELKNGGQGYVLAMRDVLPVGLGGLMLVGFGAAHMSTVSTHLNWGASYIVNDWISQVRPSWLVGRKGLLISQIIIVGLGLMGLCGTLVVERVESVWLFLIECGAGTGGVLIMRWFWWRITAAAELAATVLPFVLFGAQQLAAHYFDVQFFTFPTSYFITVGGSTLGWLLVVWVAPKPRPDSMQTFDERVEPMGWWPNKRAGRNRKVGVLLIAWVVSALSIWGFLLGLGQMLVGDVSVGLGLVGGSLAGAGVIAGLGVRYKLFASASSD